MIINRQRALIANPGETTDGAFAAFAAARLDESYRLARLILLDDHEAQDATHDAFAAAWQKWRTLRDPERVDAWFGRILVNACRERLRRHARRPTVPLPDEPQLHANDPYRQS